MIVLAIHAHLGISVAQLNVTAQGTEQFEHLPAAGLKKLWLWFQSVEETDGGPPALLPRPCQGFS